MRSDSDFSKQPFKSLGSHLKIAREKANQSLAEVSGAVEIDLDFMERIEQGEQRPSEEILLLLISYFNILDEEATKLWDLAGYTDNSPGSELDPEAVRAFASILSPDLRIIYTDMVHSSINQIGVTLNFLQSGGLNGQPMIVSRLGMSKEQAQQVMETLQKTLKKVNVKTQPKFLPQPKFQKKTDTN